jgi:multidrug efflux system membrane fusion protein
MHPTKSMLAAGGFALSALAVAMLSGCDETAAKEAVAPNPGPAITAAYAVAQSVVETQEFSGRIEAVERVEIRPRVAGFIAAVTSSRALP